MRDNSQAYLIGGGIGSLAAAAFLVRDGHCAGSNISILEALPVLGGSLDGSGDAVAGYSMRGGRMFTSDNYECTWDLYKSIPSLEHTGQSVFEETLAFNELHKAHSQARLIDRRRGIVPVSSMGFSMSDRLELLKISRSEEQELSNRRISDCLSPSFFDTNFWYLWSTTFAFQPWHSAVEFKRYLLRFMLEFTRIETLAGVKRTVYNQYDSLVAPLRAWLITQGVKLVTDCTVTELRHAIDSGKFIITGIECVRHGQAEVIPVRDGDLVFLQNGSMTDASSIGSTTTAPAKKVKSDASSWSVWEKLAEGRTEFGRPKVFNSCIAQTYWESFTVTVKGSAFFDEMFRLSENEAGTGGLVSFKDSNWLLSIVLAAQPHFPNQPNDVFVFWGYALFPDRVGDYVAKPMADCSGAEILKELCGHLRFDPEVLESANCIPCRMPFLTSMFMPRVLGDRPLPIPPGTKNFSFVSQFVELPEDCVFTVEYSIRAAQTAVYQLLGIDRVVPPITPHAKSIVTKFEALLKAFV
jgi:oleate hydratase